MLKKIIYSSLIPVLTFVQIFFLFSCSFKKQLDLTLQEKRALELFFYELLLIDPGVYTLFGTKPMTVALVYNDQYSPEEDTIKKSKELLNQNPSIKWGWRDHQLPKTWPTWEKISNRIRLKKFLIVKKPFANPSTEYSNLESIFIVNIPELEIVIEQYYRTFRSIVGFDFDPKKIIFEIKEHDSNFWKIVLQHPALLGILLGYGYNNSWLFHWKLKYADEKETLGEKINAMDWKCTETDALYPTMIDLPLPCFMYIDPHPIENYQKQRDKIKKIYSNGDFLEITLQKLSEK